MEENVSSDCDVCYVDAVSYKGPTKPFLIKFLNKTANCCPKHYDEGVRKLGDPNQKKLGRNDPCHCGSGKKYKKCHGKG